MLPRRLNAYFVYIINSLQEFLDVAFGCVVETKQGKKAHFPLYCRYFPRETRLHRKLFALRNLSRDNM